MGTTNSISGKELRLSLSLVIIGIAIGNGFFVVINGASFTGFTRELGAGDLLYGIIMAMPVIGGILQVFASYYLENTGKRKQLFLISGFIQRLLWIPVAIIPLIIPEKYNYIIIWSVTILITIASASGSINGLTFYPWLGDLVPLEMRGSFFSRRSAISTATGAVAGIAAGLFLDAVQGFRGYAVVFIVAALLGTVDILCFIWIKDPPMTVSERKIPFTELFIKPFRNKNYMRFVLFVSAWNFGMNFSGPFFNVYMLEYLGMSFLKVFLFGQVVSSISTVIFARYWGRIIDKFGCKPVIAICCFVVAFLPVLWIFATPENYLIILLINFCSGIFNPGIDMSALNLSIWLAPDENRSIYVADYTLLTSSVGIALAYILGGAFMQYVKPFIDMLDATFVLGQKFSNYHALFILSGLLRMAALVFMFHRFHEENSQSPLKVLKSMYGSFRAKADAIICRNKAAN